MLDEYPILREQTRRGRVHRNILQHALFGPYKKDKNGLGERTLLLPHQWIVEWDGRHPTNVGSGDYIKEFSEHVFPLNPTGWHSGGFSRRINPELPKWLLQARDALLPEQIERPEWNRVDLVTGEKLSWRGYRTAVEEHAIRMLEQVSTAPEGYPAEVREARDWLNAQPITALRKLLRKNWTALRTEFFGMPVTTEKEWIRKDAAFRVLYHLQDHPRIFYQASEKSSRLYSAGISLHQLPRDIRKMALEGAIGLDMHACQLAVVSKTWGVPLLHEFLQDPKNSLWTQLYADLSLDATAKPLLKKVIYGITFGMEIATVRHRLKIGTSTDPGLTPDEAEAFLQHPFIVELLDARERRKQAIAAVSYVIDAFGRRLEIPIVPPRQRKGIIRSLLAQEVQSWEVRIMTSLLPILKREKDIRIVSWLHDGISLHISDPSEQDRKLRRICKTIGDVAASIGIPTRLVLD